MLFLAVYDFLLTHQMVIVPHRLVFDQPSRLCLFTRQKLPLQKLKPLAPTSFYRISCHAHIKAGQM